MREITFQSVLADDIAALVRALAGYIILFALYCVWCWIWHVSIGAALED